ncbi:MAG TPA: MarR family transcriptional regulator [Candidatus Kapabacteria bacterium]|nr:MarR family transcriptional regulator [Candidatus Kapabacteria bacterium]
MKSRASAVQQEIKQSRPFANREQEAIVALLRTTDVLRRHLSSVVDPHGITLQQYNVLRILRGAGGALPTMEIGERMIEEAPGVTRMLDRLEKKNLVKRTRQSTDRRQVQCAITKEGLRLVEALDAPVNDADLAALAGLSPEQLDGFIRSLDAVRAACAA